MVQLDPRVELLVSAVNQSFDLNIARPADVDILVINQISTGFEQEAERYRLHAEALGIRVLNFAERGVSKSRNRAIAAAQGNICVICDDDLSFTADLAMVVRSAFLLYPDASIVTFQTTDENGRLRKRYGRYPKPHSARSVASVTSFEIAFDRGKIAAAHHGFDERFGLGAEFVSGEENIFLIDALRMGLGVRYVPKVIATHPGPTSGGRFADDSLCMSKGAVFRRMYGLWALPAGVVFMLKHAMLRRMNPFRMMHLYLVGWIALGAGQK